MTPIQRFLFILLGIMSVLYGAAALIYVLGGARLSFVHLRFGDDSIACLSTTAQYATNTCRERRSWADAGKGTPIYSCFSAQCCGARGCAAYHRRYHSAQSFSIVLRCSGGSAAALVLGNGVTTLHA